MAEARTVQTGHITIAEMKALVSTLARGGGPLIEKMLDSDFRDRLDAVLQAVKQDPILLCISGTEGRDKLGIVLADLTEQYRLSIVDAVSSAREVLRLCSAVDDNGNTITLGAALIIRGTEEVHLELLKVASSYWAGPVDDILRYKGQTVIAGDHEQQISNLGTLLAKHGTNLVRAAMLNMPMVASDRAPEYASSHYRGFLDGPWLGVGGVMNTVAFDLAIYGNEDVRLALIDAAKAYPELLGGRGVADSMGQGIFTVAHVLAKEGTGQVIKDLEELMRKHAVIGALASEYNLEAGVTVNEMLQARKDELFGRLFRPEET